MKFSQSLKNNHQFRRLYARGTSAASALLAVYARKNYTPGNRLGITVGGKIGNAVRRNLIRRRLREIYRLNEEKFAVGNDIVVVARAKSVGAGYWDLNRDFLRLCKKLGLLKNEELPHKNH